MIDVRNPVRAPDGVDVALQHVGHRRAALWRYRRVDVEPVDVKRPVVEAVGDLLTLDDQKFLIGAMERVQTVHRRQKIVIGEHNELIAVFAIPAHHIVRSGITVAVERMRVRVALVPTAH